jgi:hypothetical protein
MSKKLRFGLMVLAGTLSLLASAPRPASATKCPYYALCPVLSCCCLMTGGVACVNSEEECAAFCYGQYYVLEASIAGDKLPSGHRSFPWQK